MPTNIVIPEMGESVTQGVIVAWRKQDGEYVKRDETVLDLETDKITAEIPAPASGVVKHTKAVGDTVPVGAVVGTIDESAAAPKGAAAPAKPAPPAAASSGDSNGKHSAPAPVLAGAGDSRATPLARRLADELKVDLSNVAGTGPGGRVREQDVLTLVEAKAKPVSAPATVPARPATTPDRTEGSGGVRRERMTQLRQRLAARLVESQNTAAMLTTFNEVDMTAVMDLRKQHKEAFEKKYGVGLGFMSFFTKAVVNALQAFPAVNASIVSNAKGELEIEYHGFCDIAVAVGTPKGLTVPVLRGAERLSFAEIELGIKDLATRARDGKLTLKDLQGGTFTITNGGIYGSLMSTPILNPPQTGILGMHAIKNRAVEYPVGSGQVGIRPMMYLALSYDHRLIDGTEAVQFLVSVKNAIEQPERVLLGL